MGLLNFSSQNRTVQTLIRMKSWFDSTELIKDISILKSLDPREVEVIVGWERCIEHFLSVYSGDSFVLSIQTKKSSNSQYWLYLNIGAVFMQSREDDSVSTELLLYLVQSLNLMNQSGEHGAVTLQPSLKDGIDIIYCVPIPRWARVSPFLFGKLVRNVDSEVKNKLSNIQKEHAIQFKNSQAMDAELYTDEVEDFGELEDEDLEPPSK